MTSSFPCRRTSLQFSQIRLTLARTFMPRLPNGLAGCGISVETSFLTNAAPGDKGELQFFPPRGMKNRRGNRLSVGRFAADRYNSRITPGHNRQRPRAGNPCMNPVSIFLDVRLPTAATWFYFSVVLAAALFVKFSRLLSVRNWDVLTLFLFAPGFLLLEARVETRWGYGWLLGVSAYFLLRCLGDLALVPPARPESQPEPVRPGLPVRRPVRQPDLGGRAAAAHPGRPRRFRPFAGR